MVKWLWRKEFETIFALFNDNGTQIWVITKGKKLLFEIVNVAVRLAKLDFIKYVRICYETLAASTDNYLKRPKVPITDSNHETAIVIHISSTVYQTINFFDINSPQKGFGGKMGDVVFQYFSKEWYPVVAMGWGNEFWDIMKEK